MTILDLDSSAVRTFVAEKKFTHFGEMIDSVREVPLSSVAVQVKSSYVNFRTGVNIPAFSLPRTHSTFRNIQVSDATQLITTPQLRNYVAQYVENSSDLRQKLSVHTSELSSMGISRLTGKEIPAVILVRFPDNSTTEFSISYRFVNGNTDADISFIEGSARFADGTKIPDSHSDIIGNWYFESEAAANGFIRLGALWDIPFTVPDQDSACNEQEVKIRCTRNKGCEVEVICK
ncbi:hypothetical protein PN836_015105 [Ningiella sp. W23]|uniref:hypothetical protein n=1 Tax=Ningiella sp. W23 TaxID=3023715 RepID=UPI003757269E